MVLTRPGLLSRDMSKSIILLHPGSVVIPVNSDAIKEHTDAMELGHHLELCRYPRVMLKQVPFAVT